MSSSPRGTCPAAAPKMPRFRAVLSRILNVTFTTAFRLPVHDISSGFRLYRAER